MAFWLRAMCLTILGLVSACQSRPPAPGDFGAQPRPHYKVGEPYEVNGRRYVPSVDRNYDRVGIASWYGDAFHGKPTANGEIFDKRKLTAAHTTLPMPILVEVENLENGRKIIVRLNDRGPFVDNRLIDLSHAAADALGFTEKGLAKVRVRYVGEAALHDRAPAPASARAMPPNAPGAPAARPAPLEIWGEFKEFASLDLVETVDLAQFGPVSIFSSVGASASLYSMRVGPFADSAAAQQALSAAKGAGFADARIISGARDAEEGVRAGQSR